MSCAGPAAAHLSASGQYAFRPERERLNTSIRPVSSVRRRFKTSVQPAKPYEDESVIMTYEDGALCMFQPSHGAVMQSETACWSLCHTTERMAPAVGPDITLIGEHNHLYNTEWPRRRRRRRKFTMSVQPAKAYEDASIIMSRQDRELPLYSGSSLTICDQDSSLHVTLGVKRQLPSPESGMNSEIRNLPDLLQYQQENAVDGFALESSLRFLGAGCAGCDICDAGLPAASLGAMAPAGGSCCCAATLDFCLSLAAPSSLACLRAACNVSRALRWEPFSRALLAPLALSDICTSPPEWPMSCRVSDAGAESAWNDVLAAVAHYFMARHVMRACKHQRLTAAGSHAYV